MGAKRAALIQPSTSNHSTIHVRPNRRARLITIAALIALIRRASLQRSRQSELRRASSPWHSRHLRYVRQLTPRRLRVLP